jgi:hypothetical protein
VRVLLGIICALQVASPDTLLIRDVERPPPPGAAVDSVRYGAPQIRIASRQGDALVWLLRASDTVFVAARIADSTPHPRDDFGLSLDTKGDGGQSPGHDDFQLQFRRVLDSSVVYRGRNGRWQFPQDDPDWRLGTARSGGGWEVSAREDGGSWELLLRLDPAWLEGRDGRAPRLAFRIFDNASSSWFSWPKLPEGIPSSHELAPSRWAPAR